MLTVLALKAPITTAADDKFCVIFPIFLKRQDIFESRLPADDSHEISCLIVIFSKAANFQLSSATNYRWRF